MTGGISVRGLFIGGIGEIDIDVQVVNIQILHLLALLTDTLFGTSVLAFRLMD